MAAHDTSAESRREFLRFLATTPALAGAGLLPYFLPKLATAQDLPDEFVREAADALNVFAFEPIAKRKMLPAHYGYTASGTDDEETLLANREGFKKFLIRVRRLIDVRNVDTSVEVFGQRWDTPIMLAPVGGQGKYHAEAEVASARAARVGGHNQILSTATTRDVEDVIAARGAPVWFQLYATNYWKVTEGLVKRAEDAGCPVVALTVDRASPRNMETLERYRRADTADCDACHVGGSPAERLRDRGMYRGIDLSGVENTANSGLTWELVDRLKNATSMRVMLKGIVTHEDARLALRHGVDGIVVSNHGGRSEASGRSTIQSLPEIVEAVNGRIPVIIDGGFRRGSDIFKALALGADAICIGRPYVWGLGAFVERVLEILRTEFRRVMMEAGVTSVAQINSSYIERA